MRGRLVLGLVVAMCACGSDKPANTSGASVGTDIPPALRCSQPLPRGANFTPEGSADARPPSACYGQRPGASAETSERAVEAKRLFDLERYEDAIPVLRTVGEGQSGDSKAGRQIAAFRLGVSLVRTGHEKEGMALLGAIARDPANLARPTMLASSDSHASMVQLFSGFDDNDTDCFKSGQKQLHALATYLIARERFERGAYADAMFFFAQVDRTASAFPPAQECIGLIDAKTKANPPQPH
jgi:hypothetical protein